MLYLNETGLAKQIEHTNLSIKLCYYGNVVTNI